MTFSLMIRWAAAAALPFVAAASAAEPSPSQQPSARPTQYAQLVVSERIMIRTTRLPQGWGAVPSECWVRAKGGAC